MRIRFSRCRACPGVARHLTMRIASLVLGVIECKQKLLISVECSLR